MKLLLPHRDVHYQSSAISKTDSDVEKKTVSDGRAMFPNRLEFLLQKLNEIPKNC